MEKVDVFIPCIYKDFKKLSYCIKSLCMYFKQLGDICVTMPDKMSLADFSIDGHAVRFYNDMEILHCSEIKNCRFRPNWIYQQLLKLLENITRTEYVMSFDADCVLLRGFSVFDDDGRPKLYTKPNTDKDQPSFLRFIAKATNNDLAPYEQPDIATTRYIADKQLFKKSIVKEMIGRYFKSDKDFIDFTIENSYWRPDDVKNSLFISEYEMYGRYVEKYHIEEVSISFLKQDSVNRLQFSQRQNAFSDDDIKNAIARSSKGDFDSLLIQSGCCACDIKYAGL